MKQKKQVVALVVLLVIAGSVWLWNSRGDEPKGVSGPGPIAQSGGAIGIDDPKLRIDEIAKARKAEYKSSGRNIFSEVAQPTPHGLAQPRGKTPDKVLTACGFVGVGPCLPPPPPPPPVCKLPANLKFYGYQWGVPNGTSRRAFFHDTSEEKVYVVSEGEILMNRFRVLKIGNANLEFEDVSQKCTIGTAPLEEQAGNPPGGPSGGR